MTDAYSEFTEEGKDINTKSQEIENLNSNPVNLVEDEIDILVKVRQNGSIKSVIFQSNVFIFNNLQIPIYLSFISPDDYINKYGANDANINHLENKDKILLKTCKRISVNMNYILNKYRVYVSFYNKLNEDQNNFVLLYENRGIKFYMGLEEHPFLLKFKKIIFANINFIA